MKSMVILEIIALALLGSACQPTASPTVAPASAPTFTRILTPTPSTTPEPTRIPVVTATPRPTSTPLPEPVGEDCMGECHIPDLNETLFQGAKSQPSNHKDRTACLVCHATHPKPVLPPSHVGRMDPACALCHKPDATAK
jgi:hypothetical protein